MTAYCNLPDADQPRSKPPQRRIHGIVLIDKPTGETSNRVLQRTKRLFAASKAGHTGSLDPMATGMLPVCLGAATKVSGLLLGASKTYRATGRFGIATATGDADGEVIEQRDDPAVAADQLARAIEGLRGETKQIPPMYSALKQNGRRLYELARQGMEVPREARCITVHDIELESYDWPEFRFRVHCSKGTYVRTLVTDLASQVGTVAHVTALRRLGVGPFAESDMLTLEALEALAAPDYSALDAQLKGPDTALMDLPQVSLDELGSAALQHGQRVAVAPSSPSGLVRVYSPRQVFLGVGEVDGGFELRARKLFPNERLERAS